MASSCYGHPKESCGSSSSSSSSLPILLVGLLALASLISASPDLRGIPPKDLQYYESSIIWCKDKSKSFPREHLNDNFCDCKDGTDEPGTSACPEGKFYCNNAGHRPEMLFSSRVNDGICDCCDGSDEYDGKIKCSNTCWEAGKRLREKLEKKLATFKEGFKLRTKDVDNARRKRKEQEEELSHLKKDEKSLKDVVSKLKAHLDAVEKAEKEEELQRAKEEQERQKEKDSLNEDTITSAVEMSTETKPEDLEARMVEAPEHKTSENIHIEEEVAEHHEGHLDLETATEAQIPDFRNSEDNHIGDISEPHDESLEAEAQPKKGDKDLESLSREELGKLVASRWVRDQATNEDTSQVNSADSQDLVEETESVGDSKHDHEAGEEYGDNEADWEDGDSEDDNLEDHSTTHVLPEDTDEISDSSTPSSPWWKRVLQAPQILLRLIGVNKLHFSKSEAEQIKKEYSEANSKLISLQHKVSDLETKLKQDFGKDGEFFSFYDECFEKQLNKYVYKICPYQQATQNENRATSRLGNWQGFTDDYRTMVFSNGDKCWNGPDRSLRVRLRCGLKNEVINVEEPSRCEYVADLATPAFCLESRLLDLQKQWSTHSEMQPLHEEL